MKRARAGVRSIEAGSNSHSRADSWMRTHYLSQKSANAQTGNICSLA